MPAEPHGGGHLDRRPSTITLDPGTVVRRLGIVIALLVLANVAAAISYFFLGHQSLLGLVNAFSLNRENNFPSYVSGIMLLLAAGLLATIAHGVRRRQEPFARHWQGLAIIFALLSLDEITSVHEIIGASLAVLAGITGVRRFYFWVVPAAPLLLVLAVSYTRFLVHLPPRYRRLFILAGALYVGGAVGFEIVSAWHATRYGYLNFLHAMIFTVEETLEMSGTLLFIYALLHYLGEHVVGIHVAFAGGRRGIAGKVET
jgi:hypothetical protein